MDIRETTRTHYDTKASTVTSLSERARGHAGPLKKFHNFVKRSLIQEYVQKGSSLLDIATGRGGDLQKWADVGVTFVKGLDISEAELHEARRRYTALAPPNLECHFEHISSLGIEVWKDDAHTYDVVTCMFALHYFFGSEQSLRCLLRTVAANLKEGGSFIGIVPDGRRVNEYLMRGQSTSFFNVTALWQGPPQPFGSAYAFEITDTVTQGGPLEYLVYENVLWKLAETVGLSPVLRENGSVFTHLDPPYTGDAREASRIYATFAFKKI